VEPAVFGGVDDFMAYITGYIQMHGLAEPELAGTALFGRYNLYPMCRSLIAAQLF